MNNYYQLLLKHPKWFERRKSILKRDKNQCVLCTSKIQLEVHHRQYHFSKSKNTFVPPWQYDEKYLITICNNCHQKGHQQIKKIPIFKIK